MQSNPRAICLERDYYFHSTPAPFGDLADEGIRSLVVEGKLQFMLRRDTTPNIWGVVPAGQKGGDFVQPENWQRLDGFRPDLRLLEEEERSTPVVDYGPGMAAYIPMATTNAFADAGKPLWTRFRLKAGAADRAIARRQKALASAAWFNDQFARAPLTLRQLSDTALAVLARGYMFQGEGVWMYRSVASAALELVRAGLARVGAEGLLKAVDGDRTEVDKEVQRRNVHLSWIDPPHIVARQEARARHPLAWTTSFRARRPAIYAPHHML